MSSVRRRLFLALALAVALVASGAALAGRGDPQKRLTPADTKRAQAMLLRKADLSPLFTEVRVPETDSGFYCRALDESDLVVSGEATSPQFRHGVTVVSSSSQVYASNGDSRTAWRRATSAAGERCLRGLLARGFAQQGVRVVSFRRAPLPRIAEQAVAYHLVVEAQGVRVHVDFAGLRQSRAQAGLFAGTAFGPLPRAEVVRLARIVGRRMASAMRGA